jgi:hypothetical protein
MLMALFWMGGSFFCRGRQGALIAGSESATPMTEYYVLERPLQVQPLPRSSQLRSLASPLLYRPFTSLGQKPHKTGHSLVRVEVHGQARPYSQGATYQATARAVRDDRRAPRYARKPPCLFFECASGGDGGCHPMAGAQQLIYKKTHICPATPLYTFVWIWGGGGDATGQRAIGGSKSPPGRQKDQTHHLRCNPPEAGG